MLLFGYRSGLIRLRRCSVFCHKLSSFSSKTLARQREPVVVVTLFGLINDDSSWEVLINVESMSNAIPKKGTILQKALQEISMRGASISRTQNDENA